MSAANFLLIGLAFGFIGGLAIGWAIATRTSK